MSQRQTPFGTRLALAIGTSVIVVLLVEGVLSMFFEMSIRERARRALRQMRGVSGGEVELESLPVLVQEDAERFRAAASLPGVYRVHDDPHVGYVFKPDSEFDFRTVPVLTDHLGLRRRQTPEPSDPYRIAILGDSIAFGQGLPGEHCLATQLEDLLVGCHAADGRPFACRTVAVPSWNWRDAMAFLRSHYDELQPDLVVYIFVVNDLDDSFTAYETGHRRQALGPEQLVFVQRNYGYQVNLARRIRQEGGRLRLETMGPDDLIQVGLSPESAGRMDAMARAILELDADLARNDARLHLMPYLQSTLWAQLRQRLAAAPSDIPFHLGLENVDFDDTLQERLNDSHPNETTIGGYAVWLARDLQQAGIVLAAAGHPGWELPAALSERRVSARSMDEVNEHLRAVTSDRLSRLRPTISDATGEGVRQVYGGLHLDGTMGPELVAVIAAEGNRLEVRLAGLDSRPDLYPNPIDVRVDGVSVGALDVVATGTTSQSFELPTAASSGPREVRLTSTRWGMVSIKGKTVPASCRFVSLALK